MNKVGRSPSELATFAPKGALLKEETAALAKEELDKGLPFGSVLTSQNVKQAKKTARAELTLGSRLAKLFSKSL
ncbi:MAG: hypothetical protein SGCHY_001571 [Lobulomycetales sp.]